MPKEEKEKKRFKAVTEEVSSPAAPEEQKVEQLEEVTPTEEEIKEPVSDKDIVEEKPMLAVRETDNYSGEAKPEKGMFLKIFLVTFFATLLAFLLAGGIYVYLNGSKGLEIPGPQSETPIPQASEMPVTSPTTEPNVDVSNFKVSVLNGNGGIGVAGAAKSVIESAGFKVSNTTNADSFDFEETEIAVKSGVSAGVVAKLKTALETKYKVKIGETLPTSSSYDIIVTVGAK